MTPNDTSRTAKRVSTVSIEQAIAEITAQSRAERTARSQSVANIAPEILEIVASTLVNPAAGLATIIRKVMAKAKASDQIQEDAEKRFKEMISTIEEQPPSIVEGDGDLHAYSLSLAREINRVAESAVRLNDKVLMKEVFDFYRKAMKKLSLSQPGLPIDKSTLADIQAELGLTRLNVMWAEAQMSARVSTKADQDRKIIEELEKAAKKERLLQSRVLLILLIYTAVITAILILGGNVLTSSTVIPLLGIPVPIVLWSALGSLGNMLYKYYKQGRGTGDIENELKWVWACPIVGILMGAVVYLVVISGLTVIGVTATQTNVLPKSELLWLFSFLGGFSDGIFEGVIRKIGLMTISETSDNTQVLEKILEAYAKDSEANGSTSMRSAKIPQEHGKRFNTTQNLTDSEKQKDRPSLGKLHETKSTKVKKRA
jgi:hypothetical protein